MKAFAWVAGAAAIMALTPGAALAAKPDKAKGPKPKAEAKVVAEAPGKEHAHGGKKVEPKAPAKVEAKAPGKAEPRGKAYGHARKETRVEAPPPAAPEAKKARPEAKKARSDERPRAGRGKVTLCHATGSATNPYVVITVSVNATTGNGHGRHADDIIPAPAGGCETTQPGPEEPGSGGGDPGGGGPGGGGEDPAGPSPDPKVDPKPGDGVDRPVLVSQPGPPAAAAASPAREELPFTGLPLTLVVLLGAAALGTGALLRRKGRPSGSTAGSASR
jgi:hypothetical protein